MSLTGEYEFLRYGYEGGSTKVGTQHMIDEADIEQVRADALLPAPPGWWTDTHTGEPLPDFMAVLRRQRTEH